LPKETFFNLKEEKRKRILDAGLKEIVNHGYDGASVTRIVKLAGIATGSFYQYFEDLDDLFVFITEEAARLKVTYMQRAVAETGKDDLESAVRAMYRGGLLFGLENPNFFNTVQRLMQIKDTPLYRRMVENAKSSELLIWMYGLVQRAAGRGELQDGLSPELFFRLMMSINAEIMDYLIAVNPDWTFSVDELERFCELGMQVTLHGILKSNGRENRTATTNEKETLP
jgi:AcrR family transcriptional regulator